MNELPYRKEYLSYNKRILLFWGTFIVCLLLTASITSWFGGMVKDRITLIFLSTAVQNVCVFMLPALLTAYCITPRPIAFLGLSTGLKWKPALFVLAVMVISMPALNYLVYLNESIDLPDSSIEQWFRSTEAAARAVTDELLSVRSAGMLIVSVLLVGVLTGLGEEMFFRGAQQRIFLLRGINGHAAIWITAIIFSALHFQFYGFLPRMLLGAFFGYLAWKGGSLWLPVLAHAFNNSVVVIFGYVALHYPSFAYFETYGVPGEGEFPFIALVSFVVTVIVIVIWGRKILCDH